MTDKEIAKRLRQKDMDIFDYIMEHYNKLLWVVVGNILEKTGSSEDIEYRLCRWTISHTNESYIG
ncbi:MAG: hypothetical protein GX347_03195 [Epulopiscium sp.]|nr:hypothetical protein [Candidatus Epulonipiscium sp.]